MWVRAQLAHSSGHLVAACSHFRFFLNWLVLICRAGTFRGRQEFWPMAHGLWDTEAALTLAWEKASLQ